MKLKVKELEKIIKLNAEALTCRHGSDADMLENIKKHVDDERLLQAQKLIKSKYKELPLSYTEWRNGVLPELSDEEFAEIFGTRENLYLDYFDVVMSEQYGTDWMKLIGAETGLGSDVGAIMSLITNILLENDKTFS